MRLPDRTGSYLLRVKKAVADLQAIKSRKGANVTLSPKADSHVFRNKLQKSERLDLRHFTRVIRANLEQGWVDVEGMIAYDDLVNYLRLFGYVPKIIPELRSITVGGAVSGVGVEATSFKFGLVHETILEMDVLTGNGELVTCSRDGKNRDLFFGMPNSYGVLGYILRARVEIMPAKGFVQLRHERYTDPEAALRALKQHSEDMANDFVEGVAYAQNDIRLLLGRFVEKPPHGYRVKDVRLKRAFYESVRDDLGEVEYLESYDYLWRWDADAYWATRGSLLQKPWVRRVVGESLLRSDRLLKLLEHPLTKSVQRLAGVELESAHKLTQDIGIPVRSWGAYFDWWCKNVNQFPMWLCTTTSRSVPLFQTDEGGLYCDFGSFSVELPDEAAYRKTLRNLEGVMFELGGVKCFYSDNALSEEGFWRIVDQKAYRALKTKYDTDGLLPELFDKCIKVCGPVEAERTPAVLKSA